MYWIRIFGCMESGMRRMAESCVNSLFNVLACLFWARETKFLGHIYPPPLYLHTSFCCMRTVWRAWWSVDLSITSLAVRNSPDSGQMLVWKHILSWPFCKNLRSAMEIYFGHFKLDRNSMLSFQIWKPFQESHWSWKPSLETTLSFKNASALLETTFSYCIGLSHLFCGSSCFSQSHFIHQTWWRHLSGFQGTSTFPALYSFASFQSTISFSFRWVTWPIAPRYGVCWVFHFPGMLHQRCPHSFCPDFQVHSNVQVRLCINFAFWNLVCWDLRSIPMVLTFNNLLLYSVVRLKIIGVLCAPSTHLSDLLVPNNYFFQGKLYWECHTLTLPMQLRQ